MRDKPRCLLCGKFRVADRRYARNRGCEEHKYAAQVYGRILDHPWYWNITAQVNGDLRRTLRARVDSANQIRKVISTDWKFAVFVLFRDGKEREARAFFLLNYAFGRKSEGNRHAVKCNEDNERPEENVAGGNRHAPRRRQQSSQVARNRGRIERDHQNLHG